MDLGKKIEWTNWAGNQDCSCIGYEPRNLGELEAAVQEAVAQGRRIRAAGGSYSWSPLVRNEGEAIVFMGQLRRCLARDEEARTVTVECGMTIEELDREARAMGCTLVSPTMFPKPTVGGVIATGSHGTGSRVTNFSRQILSMDIVAADGKVRTVTSNDGAVYDAARIALGTFGIVYSVKLQLAPQFAVYLDKRLVPARHVLDEFEDLQESYEYLEILWFPFQKKMWLYLMDSTGSRPDRVSAWRRWLSRVVASIKQTLGSRLVPWIARHTPALTPVLCRVSNRLADREGASVQVASDAFHFIKTYPKAYDMSYAVPARDASRAWRMAMDLVEEYARADLYPVNLALHCRFTAAGDAWLGPDYQRDTCWVEVATAKGTPHWEDFRQELEARWLTIGGARPHWGKMYGHLEGLGSRHPRMQDFLRIRDVWDPTRVFLNPFLENEVFQLPPLRAAAVTAAPTAKRARAPEQVPAPLPPEP